MKTLEGTAFENRRSLRRHINAVGILCVTLVLGAGTWAGTTSLSSAIIANGVVVVADNVKKIQHLSSGIVKEILVKEGDRVTAGQVLLRLNPTTAQTELAIVQSSLAQLYARRARLRAQRLGADDFQYPSEIDGLADAQNASELVEGERKLFESELMAQAGKKSQLLSKKQQLKDEGTGLDVQLDSLSQSIDLIKSDLATTQLLFNKQLITSKRLLDVKRQLAEEVGNQGQKISEKAQTAEKNSEIDLEILQLDHDSRKEASDKLGDVDAKIAELEQRQVTTKDELSRLDIVSPIAGRVYQMEVHTVNGVINAGETLMLVVPESDALTVDAKILPSDIDQVYVNQPARIRFSAFDVKSTPEIDGYVTNIAPDLIKDERTGTSYYSLRVNPDISKMKLLNGRQLYPGMPAEVFIKIGDRTVMTYLTKPIFDHMNRVFREE